MASVVLWFLRIRGTRAVSDWIESLRDFRRGLNGRFSGSQVIWGAAMSRSYSEDLRIRLVRLVERGASRRAAAKLFGVSPSIAVKWMQRWRSRRALHRVLCAAIAVRRWAHTPSG